MIVVHDGPVPGSFVGRAPDLCYMSIPNSQEGWPALANISSTPMQSGPLAGIPTYDLAIEANGRPWGVDLHPTGTSFPLASDSVFVVSYENRGVNGAPAQYAGIPVSGVVQISRADTRMRSTIDAVFADTDPNNPDSLVLDLNDTRHVSGSVDIVVPLCD